MSKKVFKKALGYLMSHNLTQTTEEGLRIVGEVEQYENSKQVKAEKSAPKPAQKPAHKESRKDFKPQQKERKVTERKEVKEEQKPTPAVTPKSRTAREGTRHAYTKFLRTKSE